MSPKVQAPTGPRSRPTRKPQPLARDVLLKVGTQHPKFWFLAWLEAVQRHAAIKRVTMRAMGAKQRDELAVDALCSALGHFQQEVRDMAGHCQRTGLLPLCWEGTRAMDDVGVVA